MKTIILVGVLSAITASQAGAQIINFQISNPFDSSDPGYTGVGAAPGGTSSDVWNKITLSGSFDGTSPAVTSNNVNSQGIATGVTFTDDSAQSYSTTGNGYGQPAPAIGLFASYATAINGGGGNRATITESLNNVLAGTYNLYLYSAPSSFTTTGGATFTLNGVSKSAFGNNSSTESSSFLSGVNYVVFTGVSPDALGNISFSYTNNGVATDEGDFNGLQLVSAATTTVPEPSASALILGGLVALAGWARLRALSQA